MLPLPQCAVRALAYAPFRNLARVKFPNYHSLPRTPLTGVSPITNYSTFSIQRTSLSRLGGITLPFRRNLCFNHDNKMSSPGTGAINPGKSADEFRLPTNVRPTHYDLTFKTDLEALTFQGYGIISLDVNEDTDEIQFNASGLNIEKASIQSEALKTEQTQESTESINDKDNERVKVKFATALPKGSKAKLHISWDGKLTDGMTVSEKPFVADGKEDDGKAVGKLKLAKTFSLKGESGSADGKGWKITRFEKTPLMSTYLVAFANGPFEYLESSYTSPLSGRKVPLRIYATSNVIHQAQFSLDVKAKVMPIYEQTFELEYPLPKLDTLVAHDFDAGAMENWGLITGRTSAFLLDPKKADLAAKKRVATVTSHECAHLWFGDVVTMAWWDNLWLNEGFATLMGEVIIIDKVFPEWKVNTEFINYHLNRALDLDAVRSSHPIEVPVPDANQINQIFDALSYSKAGSVLRMLAAFVGEETFLKGVSIYLKKHLYGNTVAKDLWDGIGEASGRDIPAMLDNWIMKIGFPVVTVKETPEGISVRQDRFLSTGDPSEEENQTIWQIPLNILTTDGSGKPSVDRTVVLKDREMNISLDTTRTFKLNAGTNGVYRVAYTPERLRKLGEEAAREGSVLSTQDRMGLVSDALILAKAGISSTSSGLELIKNLRGEKENLVWSSISTELAGLNKIFWEQPQEVRDNFDAFRRYLFKPIVDRLGYEYSETDSPDTVELRTLAITVAAAANDKDVVSELQSRFKHFQETGDDSKIPADLLKVTYSTAVRKGGRAEYETVKKVYKNPPTPSAKIGAMLAMAATKDKELIEEMLQFILSDVQIQDTMYYFSGASANRAARRRIGEFFEENYDKICKMFEGNFSLSYIVKFSFNGLTTEKDAEDVKKFFEVMISLSQFSDNFHINPLNPRAKILPSIILLWLSHLMLFTPMPNGWNARGRMLLNGWLTGEKIMIRHKVPHVPDCTVYNRHVANTAKLS
ncbi:Aminopeptidase 2 mitochondrial [Tulasnella sp. 419]|nr:Aminopeptidase 2 mitochondrial [Tulasnella sp. 419]